MNMNKKLIAAVAVGVIGVGGFVQTASAINGTANAVLVTPISISETTQLNFGSISNGWLSAGPGSSNVVVNDDGVTATSYGTNLAAVSPATDTRGVFAVSGSGTLAYTITIPASTTITDGSTNMNVALTTRTASTGPGTAGTLSGGADTVYVGGTLTVSDTNAAGTYSGTYAITVAYN